MTIGRYGPNGMSLREAKAEAAMRINDVWKGDDPLESKRQQQRTTTLETVDDLANHWLNSYKRNEIVTDATIKVYRRLYKQEISPVIGQMRIEAVGPLDIDSVLDFTRSRKASTIGHRPTVTNDVLTLCKSLFNHGISRDCIRFNPAAALSHDRDAGGPEAMRTRWLAPSEIAIIFDVFRANMTTFGRDNLLLCALLLTLGVRKTELTEAQWHEFSLESRVWRLPASRSKNGKALDIPIAEEILPWLLELRIRACGSEYVFPSRRRHKNGKPHISPSTINNALNHLFGHSNGKGREKTSNKMEEAGIKEHFTAHDLRRTFRSLLTELQVPSIVAEKCMNHTIKGVEGIYDHSELFNLRAEAMTKLAKYLSPYIADDDKLTFTMI